MVGWHPGRLTALVHILKKYQRSFILAIYTLEGHFSGWHISTKVQSATPKDYFTSKDTTDLKLKLKTQLP